MMYEIISFLH